MGLILDTSILIDAERRLQDADQMLAGLSGFELEDFAISALSLMELAHGVVRARTDAVRKIRKRFLDDLQSAVPAIAVSSGIAIRAGLLDGSLRQEGITIGAADALIAATCLEGTHAVVTHNVKHFRAVPDLKIVEL